MTTDALEYWTWDCYDDPVGKKYETLGFLVYQLQGMSGNNLIELFFMGK
ncbi:MAG: hypothetical protein HXX20_02235 [Chloroflexi bacterium]|nr:hypothetical protein [Chloroflexota bacterium]